MPVMVATLSIFWLLSGALGLFSLERAAAVLPADVLSLSSAKLLVITGAVMDLLLGLSILVRSLAKKACVGMVAVSLGYLVVGSVLTPVLWSDPLGPFVKVLPSIVLALVTLALLEER